MSNRFKVTRASCKIHSENRYERSPRAGKIGDAVTVDQNTLKEENESRSQHEDAVVVQD